MPITLSWLDPEETILLTTFEGEWTYEEQLTSQRQQMALQESKPYTVHSITDLTRSGPMPVGVLSHLPRTAAIGTARNQGAAVVVGVKGLARHATEIFSQVYSHVEIADTLEQALSVVEAHTTQQAH